MPLPRGKLQQIAEITSFPAGGKSLSLDPQGHAPIASSSGRWTLEYVAVTLDIGNTAAHTGGTNVLTIPNLRVGDLCFFIGKPAGAAAMIFETDGVCTSDGVITLRYFNADAAALDPPSIAYKLLVMHRNVIS